MDEVLTPQGVFRREVWTWDEDIELFRQIIKFGCNWSKIQIGTRKTRSVMNHYYRLQKGRILNPAEMRFVHELLQQYGMNPRFIAAVIRYDINYVQEQINLCLAQFGGEGIREWPHGRLNQPDIEALTNYLLSLDISTASKCKKSLTVLGSLLSYQFRQALASPMLPTLDFTSSLSSESQSEGLCGGITQEEYEALINLGELPEPEFPKFHEEIEMPEWLKQDDELPEVPRISFDDFDMH
jgi:hypothetical protein